MLDAEAEDEGECSECGAPLAGDDELSMQMCLDCFLGIPEPDTSEALLAGTRGPRPSGHPDGADAPSPDKESRMSRNEH